MRGRKCWEKKGGVKNAVPKKKNVREIGLSHPIFPKKTSYILIKNTSSSA